jgi:RNA polymerase sigma factor (sigma-70 family)
VNIDNDLSLISRVLADHDHRAFGELVRRHQAAVRRFLRRLVGGNAASADDLAQETFVTVYQTLNRFRGTSAFSTWLLGIAYNKFRAARRSWKPTLEWTDADSALNTSGDSQTASDLRHDLEGALLRLSPVENACAQLCCIHGLTHEEAAQTLDIPLGTAKTHVLRAKEKLRHSLQAWAPVKTS